MIAHFLRWIVTGTTVIMYRQKQYSTWCYFSHGLGSRGGYVAPHFADAN
uniref:Uncharacterized protein n=1 Tax=Anguilla anguilla TaxID=7936 RepID=A0A0E9RIS5_ANGAN